MEIIQLVLLMFSPVLWAETDIKFAAVLYRHGDRTPVDTYPTDPWRNESLWPVKFGELTNRGKMQHYVLGKWLRQRYAHLLSEEFDPTEIYVKSTDVDRTLMSAEANLAGMYPPVGKYVWDKNLLWQPVPVHTVPVNQDEILAMQKPCAAYVYEMTKFLSSVEYKEKINQYENLMNYLSLHTGRNIKDFYGIEEIYSILHIETLYNFTLPNWTHAVYPKEMHKPACYSFTINAANPILARLKAGPLIQEIMSKMSQVSKGNSYDAHKVYIYSGHDLTVGTVLTALGMYDGNCPVYTATILMELIEDNSTGNHYIRISYRNTINITEPQVLSIPGCGTACPLDSFMKLYDNLVTVDFKRDCNHYIRVMIVFPLYAISMIILLVYGYNKAWYQAVIFQEQLGRINESDTRTNTKTSQCLLPDNGKGEGAEGGWDARQGGDSR